MSVKAMAAVFDRYPNGGGEMMLALALADHASDDGSRIYPSIKHLASKTRQSERTVQYQLRRMEDVGWLILVNAGNGGRNHHREYEISPAWLKGADFAPPEKGATDDTKGATQNTKGATDDSKGCNPLHPHITITEPSKNHQEPKEGSASLAPFGVCDAVWQDFLKVRKANNAPMTNTALLGIQREADKAGVSLEDALKTCCERGWRGFKADWVNDKTSSRDKPSASPQALSFAERDEMARRAKWEEMTGRRWPTSPANGIAVFDMETQTLEIAR